MRFLQVFFHLFVLICVATTSHAQSCLSRTKPKTNITFLKKPTVVGRLHISSKRLQCSNSISIASKKSGVSLSLRKGIYQLNISVPSCNNVKKKITISNKKSKFKIKLNCKGINPRDEEINHYVLEQLQLAINSKVDLKTLGQHIEALVFEEIFNLMTEADITPNLNIENAFEIGFTINSILQEKGLDPLKLMLNAGGLLTAGASLQGSQRILSKDTTNPLANVLTSVWAFEKLKQRFYENKVTFLLRFSPSTLKKIFLKSELSEVSPDPILLVANELIPLRLQWSSPDIVRRFAITLDFTTGEKADGWTIPGLVNTIQTLDPSRRTFFVTFSEGSPVSALDPLRDKYNGDAVIEKSPGVPHRFPSYDEWKKRVSENLRNYLTSIKAEMEARGDFTSPARYVAIDFESIRNDWESTVLYYAGQHSLLLLDAKINNLMERLSLTENDIRSMDTWLATDPRRLRWDSYMLQHRADALSQSIGETFREVFNRPDIIISNYDDTLRSDTVPNGAFAKKEFRIWGSPGTSLIGGLPSIPLYGLQYQRISTPEGEIISTPPAPSTIHVITENEFNTRNNTFVSTLNRVNSISSATSLKTNHYVTVKDFIDVWHDGYYGPCVRYFPDPGQYRRVACGESEGIGDFMFEYWALAAQNSEFLNLYTLSPDKMPITLEQALFAKHSMNEINRVLGYSDRGLAKNAVAYIDGVRTSVSANKAPYGKPFYVWASRANNKNVFRVVFMAPNNFDKKITIIRDGSAGDGAQISYGGSFLEIPGGVIDAQSANDTLTPYGFFITQDINFNRLG